ncbi:MAG: ATP-binding cassette domain-containing protein [Firmicutes bacterium]|nr:ATP-binding cassette domain-containing protein [Bacillota bacterium]
MDVVEVTDLHFTYPKADAPVLRGVSFSLRAGEEVALVGHGGAGKSTLARLIAGLLTPTHGRVEVRGRGGPGRVGLVFQNPENQLVGLTVEEDIAFGPGNLGLPTEEIVRRVDHAVAVCGLAEMRERPLSTLSGGEKQRVAIAGALAMHPACLILDEATAMLDRPAQDELNVALQRSKDELGIAVLRITHSLGEALYADRVLVLAGGVIAAAGRPWEVLWDADALGRWRLAVPPLYRAARVFAEAGFPESRQVRTPKELAAAIWPWISKK